MEGWDGDVATNDRVGAQAPRDRRPAARPPAPRGRATPFSTGVIWNLGSLAFLALAGFVLNIVIGAVYGPEALGVFNIAFALFIFFSQLGTFGLHASILQIVSEHAERDTQQVDSAVAQGLLLSVAIASAVSVLGLALTPLLPMAFGVDGLEAAWLAILPGLWAFSINKFLYNVINGARHMRTFAVLQSLRYALILAALLILISSRAPAALLTLTFTVSEICLLPVLAAYAGRAVTGWRWTDGRRWRRAHLWFGSRAVLSGAFLELNTRVDVLIIGVALNEERAGVYSVALLIVEGASQVVFALRNNINPLLARLVADGDRAGLLKLSRRVALGVTPVMLCAAVVCTALYPLFERAVFGGQAFEDARLPLALLLGGFGLSSGVLCFNMILTQAGRPALHSIYVLSVLVVNVILNLILVPAWGISGAGAATAAAYVFSAIAVIVAVRATLGMRLVF